MLLVFWSGTFFQAYTEGSNIKLAKVKQGSML